MKKFKILVVEDETDVRDLISLHLKREGYDIVAVEDAEKAMTALNQTADTVPGAVPFNLAIVDWMLPGVSGLE